MRHVRFARSSFHRRVFEIAQLVAIAPLAFVLGTLDGCRSGSETKPSNAPLPLDEARRRVAAIELCKTRDEELLTTFGEPMRDGRSGRLHIRSWLLATGGVERVLALALDEHGTVVDISWDVPGIATWIPRNQCGRTAPSGSAG